MKAIITVINKQKGMYAGEIEKLGDFVIFECLDSYEPEIGDIIENENFFNMGSETFINITQNCSFEVFVEDVCGKSFIRERCLF